MYIKLCDRCGRVTGNRAALLLPSKIGEQGGYQYNGVWFGEGVTLCNNCLDDFEKFYTEHEVFNHDSKLVYEKVKK